MGLELGWGEILWRLTLTVVAGALVGANRGGHGRPAGLRTTLLVCLTASVSMLQTNLLLATSGKANGSFVTLDMMRLPLGILTGMGFIGGGVILKKGDIVMGVTTAATLWFVTVVGLCLGGGQKSLGLAALAIGMVVLVGLKRLEDLLPRDRRALLCLTSSFDGTTEAEIHSMIEGRGFSISSAGTTYDREAGRWTFRCEVRWRARASDPPQPALAEELSRRPGVARLEWRPQGLPDAAD